MMEEKIKPTADLLNIFKRVQLLIYKEMNDLFKNFSLNTYKKQDDHYIVSDNDSVIGTEIILERRNKSIKFQFAEIQMPLKTIYMISLVSELFHKKS